MNDIEIDLRKATEKDVVRVSELCSQLGYQANPDMVLSRLKKIDSEREHRVWVAEIEGLVVGWIQCASRITIESGEFAEIVGLVVDEKSRTRGIGRKLVEKAERWAKEIGQQSIRVRTNVKRVESNIFYRTLGFSETKKQSVLQKSI
ncbi:MAG TPA: GNAT family N-acetyltransferase [Candidatus Kryptonia bacterium]